MATPAIKRARATPTPTLERNARLSSFKRAKRPLPATRREADELFAPSPRMSDKPALGSRLERLSKLGCLALVPPGTGQVTSLQAHQAILDALYPEG